MKIAFLGDNLHEMSNPISVKQKENIIQFSSAQFSHRMARLKTCHYITQ